MFIGKNTAKKIIIEDVVQNVSEYLITVYKKCCFIILELKLEVLNVNEGSNLIECIICYFKYYFHSSTIYRLIYLQKLNENNLFHQLSLCKLKIILKKISLID